MAIGIIAAGADHIVVGRPVWQAADPLGMPDITNAGTQTGNNATNRWTGALAIPQEPHRVYLTPTPSKFEALLSRVAPLVRPVVATLA